MIKVFKKKHTYLFNYDLEFELKLYQNTKIKYFFWRLGSPAIIFSKSNIEIIVGLPKKFILQINHNYLLWINFNKFIYMSLKHKNIKIIHQTADQDCQRKKRLLDIQENKKEKKIKIKDEIAYQKKQGRCNLTPFPILENKVRTGLSIEQHSLFASNTFKRHQRIYKRNFYNLSNKEKFTCQIKIGNADSIIKGVLKQHHQELFYKILQFWEKQKFHLIRNKNKHYGIILMSVYELVKSLRGGDRAKDYKYTHTLLQEMAAIPIEIKRIYSKNNKYDIESFSLISFEWRVKEFNKHTMRPGAKGKSEARIMLSSFLTENFLQKKIKSITLRQYLDLKDEGRNSGIAQLLYIMLDYELSSKEKYHITLSRLSQRLGMNKYKYKSSRKRIIQPALKKLQESSILNKKYKFVFNLKKSNNKKDFILIAKRINI